MAFIAAQTRYKVVLSVLVQQLAIVGVGDPGARHRHQIQLSVRNGLVGNLRIEIAPHVGDQNVKPSGLDPCR